LFTLAIQEDEPHTVKHRDLDIQFEEDGKTSIGFRKSTGLEYRLTFSTLASGRITVRAPERNQEHSIRLQLAALNVGTAERMRQTRR